MKQFAVPAVFTRLPRRAYTAIAVIAIVAITLLAYRNSFRGVFLLDDELSIRDNPSIKHLADLRTVLTPTPSSTLGGRPAANLSFAINYALGGLHPTGYHILNLLIHISSALCLFGIVRRTVERLRRPGDWWLGLCTAVLWSLHPVQTNVVTYISQRTEGLMGLFYLLTLYCFIRGGERPSLGHWLPLAIFCCAVGMASKEVMATAPLVILLYDRTFIAGTFAAAWQSRRSFYTLLGGTWLILAYLLTSGLEKRAVGFGLGVSPIRYAITECHAILLYLRDVFWPHPLVFDYGPYGFYLIHPLRAILEGAAVLGLVVTSIGIAAKHLTAGFLLLGFFIVLSPTSSFVPIVMQPIAESRLHLPLAFIIALAVAGLARLVKPAWLFGLMFPIVSTFAIMTDHRNLLFTDGAALWRDTIAKVPENARAYSNLSAVLYGQKRTAEAIEQSEIALKIDPYMTDAHANLATVLVATGHYAKALEHARAALQLRPSMPNLRIQAGYALLALNQPDEAIPYYEAETKLRPDYAFAYHSLGIALCRVGRYAEAVTQFKTALRLDPEVLAVFNDLAASLFQIGQIEEAIRVYRNALQKDANDVTIRTNLAIVLARIGRFDEAEAEFNAALRVKPDYQPAMDRLNELIALRAKTSSQR